MPRYYRTVSVDAEVDAGDVIGCLSAEDLHDFGLHKIPEPTLGAFGKETTELELARLAAQRGDLRDFLEHCRKLFDAEGIFLRVDRLLPAAREVAHG